MRVNLLALCIKAMCGDITNMRLTFSFCNPAQWEPVGDLVRLKGDYFYTHSAIKQIEKDYGLY